MLAFSAWTLAGTAPADAKKMIEDTTNDVLAALTKQKETLKADPKHVYKIVDSLVLPRFDFARMSKFVLGTHWKTATPAQQKHFVEAFRDLLVRTYSTALVEAAGEHLKVNYLPIQNGGAPRITLKTEVAQGNAKPITVEYAMYVPDAQWMKEWNISTAGWKVYNVTIEGVSLVTNYRTEFGNDVEKIGMDGLIKKVQSKQIEK